MQFFLAIVIVSTFSRCREIFKFLISVPFLELRILLLPLPRFHPDNLLERLKLFSGYYLSRYA